MAANVALVLLSSCSPSTSAAAASLLPRRRFLPSRRRRASSRATTIMSALGDDPIREWILTEGKATQIKGIRSIGGGCINSAQRYDTDVGPFFVKTNSRIGPEMFEGEALGLKAMYDTKSIRVPLPYKVGSLPTGGSFIIMEFIEFGRSKGRPVRLGRKLAEMHKAAKSDKGYGFPVDNTIGSTPQINTLTDDWIEFYSKHRLGQRLIKNIRPLFDGAVIEPCLLHGDLWSGNISSDSNGDPVILDPACYCNKLQSNKQFCKDMITGSSTADGHNEGRVWDVMVCWIWWGLLHAYFQYFYTITLIQVMPKQPGFEKRRDLYLLYHYLNHYNLFGSGYRSSAMSIIEDYLYVLAI
ncbi:Protein-ribulosamine 3-kinase, chloroplastic [Zea mays]|uniref:protein-ribulosamine 3-kinase n=1 Tax=Zea mays TaxID=4577 RepID=A0A3L6D6F1_MAIZE|nr:Protein-ribulosamine 3-kinase, chloroplastic [Zea mays]